MDKSTVKSNLNFNEDTVSTLLGKNAEQVDMLLSRYKYHVLKSAIGAENKRVLCLVEDVRNKDGEILLAKGTAQSESSLRQYIGKLLQHDLEHPIEYYLDVIQPDMVKKIHSEMNQIAEALSLRGICDFKSIKKIIDEVVLNLGTNHTLLNRLTVFKGEYPSGFNESLATAVIAASVGEKMGYRFDERVEAFTAGLFHHIGELPIQHLFGKHKIPYEEVKKMKGHPLAGYMILSSKDISENIKAAVLKHHINLDGSGYPDGLTLTDEDDLAKLINITSTLVTMCSRGKRSLRTALKLLDIYSRSQTRCGDAVTPLYDRPFYEVLKTLNLSVIDGGDREGGYPIDEIRALHFNYIKLNKINSNLETLIHRLKPHAINKEIPPETREELDVVLSYASRMENLTSDTRVIIGVDQLAKSNTFASDLMVDMEVIISELGHYLPFFEESIGAAAPFLETTHDDKLVKRAQHILNQIRYQLPRKIVEVS